MVFHFLWLTAISLSLAQAQNNPYGPSIYPPISPLIVRASELLRAPNLFDPGEDRTFHSRRAREDGFRPIYAGFFEVTQGDLWPSLPPGTMILGHTNLSLRLRPDMSQTVLLMVPIQGGERWGICGVTHMPLDQVPPPETIAIRRDHSWRVFGPFSIHPDPADAFVELERRANLGSRIYGLSGNGHESAPPDTLFFLETQETVAAAQIVPTGGYRVLLPYVHSKENYESFAEAFGHARKGLASGRGIEKSHGTFERILTNHFIPPTIHPFMAQESKIRTALLIQALDNVQTSCERLANSETPAENAIIDEIRDAIVRGEESPEAFRHLLGRVFDLLSTLTGTSLRPTTDTVSASQALAQMKVRLTRGADSTFENLIHRIDEGIIARGEHLNTPAARPALEYYEALQLTKALPLLQHALAEHVFAEIIRKEELTGALPPAVLRDVMPLFRSLNLSEEEVYGSIESLRTRELSPGVRAALQRPPLLLRLP